MIEENISIEKETQKSNRCYPYIALAFFVFLIITSVLYYLFMSPPDRGAKSEQFVVTLSMKTGQAIDKLKSSGFVRSSWMFDTVLRFYDWKGEIPPGSYDLSKSQNVFSIAKVLTKPPRGVWVVIPEGFRKEEIAEMFVKSLGWTEEMKQEFITVDTNQSSDLIEGVYFPDTYLMPRNGTPKDAAKRLYSHFQEKFAPFSEDAIKQNIKWTTALKVASLIQREGKNANDMSVISAVIWNRLEKKMRLQVDATVQYARGDTGNGWWSPISKADLQIDSPYNTYKYAGLPPHPIANPGITAIKSALHPADTKCVYYIHDSSGVIHCSETYEGQQANVNKYLK